MHNKIDKKQILTLVIAEIDKQFTTALYAAETARSGSTHDDAEAKSKYDTQATELSYLADGQGMRAEALAKDLRYAKQFQIREFIDDDAADVGAMVVVAKNSLCYYFILPFGAGTTVQVENQKIQVISPQSSLGKALIDSYTGDVLENNHGKIEVIY